MVGQKELRQIFETYPKPFERQTPRDTSASATPSSAPALPAAQPVVPRYVLPPLISSSPPSHVAVPAPYVPGAAILPPTDAQATPQPNSPDAPNTPMSPARHVTSNYYGNTCVITPQFHLP